ncbi:hypothetical protein Tco_0611713 [Tanacetum coccineum]
MYEEWGRQTFGCYRIQASRMGLVIKEDEHDTLGRALERLRSRHIPGIPYRVGSMQVLQGAEFEVEPLDGHTFEVDFMGMSICSCFKEVKLRIDILSYQHVDREQHQYGNIQYRDGQCMVLGQMCNVSQQRCIGNAVTTVTDSVAITGSYTRLRSRLPRVCWLKQRDNILVVEDFRGLEWVVYQGTVMVEEKNASCRCGYVLDKFDRGLQIEYGFMDFDYAMGRSNHKGLEEAVPGMSSSTGIEGQAHPPPHLYKGGDQGDWEGFHDINSFQPVLSLSL